MFTRFTGTPSECFDGLVYSLKADKQTTTSGIDGLQMTSNDPVNEIQASDMSQVKNYTLFINAKKEGTDVNLYSEKIEYKVLCTEQSVNPNKKYGLTENTVIVDGIETTKVEAGSQALTMYEEEKWASDYEPCPLEYANVVNVGETTQSPLFEVPLMNAEEYDPKIIPLDINLH